jgi:hypothetical protein
VNDLLYRERDRIELGEALHEEALCPAHALVQLRQPVGLVAVKEVEHDARRQLESTRRSCGIQLSSGGVRKAA